MRNLTCSLRQSTIEDIDEVLVGLIDSNAETRLTAAQALDKLVERVNAIPPKTLLIPPVVYDLTSPVPKVIQFNFVN